MRYLLTNRDTKKKELTRICERDPELLKLVPPYGPSNKSLTFSAYTTVLAALFSALSSALTAGLVVGEDATLLLYGPL